MDDLSNVEMDGSVYGLLVATTCLGIVVFDFWCVGLGLAPAEMG